MSQLNVLAKAWPGVFEEGERLPTARVVPIDFDRFLTEAAGHATAYVIRYLHQALPFDGGFEVSISTGKLAMRLGVDPANVRRVQREPQFLALVNFMPGVMRMKGAVGIPGRYDLRPLFAAYRAWRDINTPGQGDRGPGDREVQATAPTRSRRPGVPGQGDRADQVKVTTLQVFNDQTSTDNTSGEDGSTSPIPNPTTQPLPGDPVPKAKLHSTIVNWMYEFPKNPKASNTRGKAIEAAEKYIKTEGHLAAFEAAASTFVRLKTNATGDYADRIPKMETFISEFSSYVPFDFDPDHPFDWKPTVTPTASSVITLPIEESPVIGKC